MKSARDLSAPFALTGHGPDFLHYRRWDLRFLRWLRVEEVPVVTPTVAFSVRPAAAPADGCAMARSHMRSRGIEKFQVFDSVVRPDSIDVVNNLCRLQVSAKAGLHHQAVFEIVATFASSWMIGGSNLDVAVSGLYSSLPTRIVFAFRLAQTLAPIRAVLSTLSKSAGFSRDRLFAVGAGPRDWHTTMILSGWTI
jgi:hypothetical protein